MTEFTLRRLGPSTSVHVAPLTPRTHLQGLKPDSAARGDQAAGAVTGGGFAALIGSGRGLRALWRGEEPLVGRVELLYGDSVASPVPGFRSGRGRWTGTYTIQKQKALEETALLSDDPPAVVLQWSLLSGRGDGGPFGQEGGPGRLLARFIGLDDVRIAEITLPLSEDAPAVCCLLPEGSDAGRTVSLLRSLKEREIRRAKRLGGGEDLNLWIDGSPVPEVEAAQRVIAEACLSVSQQEPFHAPVLGGFSGREPCYLRGSPLVEFGLGALWAGHPLLARHVLAAATRDDAAPVVALTFFLASYALATGDLEAIRASLPDLVRAATRLPTAASSSGFPTPTRTLELLLKAVEPLGQQEWKAELEAAFARLDRDVSPGGVRLPIASRGAASQEEAEGSLSPRLPPAMAFAHPELSGLGHRRTLHSARLIRSWSEEEMAIEPDAAYGRLRVSPRIDGRWDRFELRGLRVGDATVTLEYERDGLGCVFRLSQQSGRLPLNLVFAPRLPFRAVERVKIGGMIADVAISPHSNGVRLECQFPLDPSRELEIVEARDPAQ